MPSPFPGMDPYLESHWGDVHTRLVTYSADQLQGRLPGDLRARVEERVVLQTEPRPRSIFPDVRVERRHGKQGRKSNGAVALAMAEPHVVDIPDEPETQRFIEIRATKDQRLVTVIEVLSPSNKRSCDGRDQHLSKQRELIEQRVSLVEIDLLRAGDWVLALPDWVASHWPSLYRVAVRRGWEAGRGEYYALALDEKLPVLRIPLRRTDKDVPLDLQALLEQCYRNGAYDDIDYRAATDPPLAGAEARWASQLLRRAGRRPSARKRRGS